MVVPMPGPVCSSRRRAPIVERYLRGRPPQSGTPRKAVARFDFTRAIVTAWMIEGRQSLGAGSISPCVARRENQGIKRIFTCLGLGAVLLWDAPTHAGPVTTEDLLKAQDNAAEWIVYGRDLPVRRTPADALLLPGLCHSTDERRKRCDRAALTSGVRSMMLRPIGWLPAHVSEDRPRCGVIGLRILTPAKPLNGALRRKGAKS